MEQIPMQRCGGFTGAKPAEQLEPEVLAALTQKLAERGRRLVGVQNFKTQVVAGTNYAFELTTDQGPAKATLWRKLDRSYELTRLE